MATKYWVGGDGNWSSLTNWRTTSGGLVITTAPGSADAAVLDANSSTNVVTVDSNITIQTLTCTGFTGTLAFGTNTISLNSTGTVFVGATTMTVTGTPQIILTDNSATARTITPTVVTEANSISFRITAGTGNFTMTSGNAAVLNLDFTDGVNPTGYGGSYVSQFHTVYGNFKASTNMTASSGTGTLTFAATSGTKTITTAAVVFDRPFTFNGVGGSWQLQDALTSGSTRTVTLTNGTLDLNNYTLTTGTFSSSNTNTRTLAFGAGKIVLTGNATTVWANGNTANLTITGTDPLVQATYSGSTGTRTFTALYNSEATSISLEVTAGSDSISLVNSSSFYKNVSLVGFTGTYASTGTTVFVYGNWNWGGVTSVSSSTTHTFLSTSGTKTITSNGNAFPANVTFNGVGGIWACQDALSVTGTLTMTNGTLQLAAGTTNTVGSFVTTGTTLKYLQSTIPGTQATISDASGTDTVTYLSVQDSNATGGATWDATASTNVYVTNNTGWNFGTLAALSGVAATGAVGSVIYSFTLGVTGVQATGSAGSLGFANAYALSSVLSTTDVGSVTPRFTVGTTGVQATSAVGSVVWGNAYALSGVQATSAVGSFSFTSTIPMSGVLATGSVQTIFGFGWGAIPDTSESWGAIPDTSETWTVIGNTSETWTPISSTS
jgi:hypothetical protein